MCGYRAAASQRCNGTTHMTGVLHWTDTGSLGRTDGMKTEQWKSMELCLGRDDEPAKTLWARTGEQTNVSNIVMGVC